MSSHREAPEIAKDPVADSTDVYAFVSPDRPDTVTIIANYIPLEDPAGGPNFFEFGDNVLYRISIDNNGDGKDDITYDFEFSTRTVNPNSFLYNTGPIRSLTDPNFNRPQTYSVTERRRGKGDRVMARRLTCPPCNVGPRSTPNYASLANAAVHDVGDGVRVFAGQRADPLNQWLSRSIQRLNFAPIGAFDIYFGRDRPARIVHHVNKRLSRMCSFADHQRLRGTAARRGHVHEFRRG